ncbi:MAG: vWA domain-containing protein [Chloroflexota bacterium]
MTTKQTLIRFIVFFGILYLTACGGKTAEETRIVTETVEVTRVVTETESIEIPAAEEPAAEEPAAEEAAEVVDSGQEATGSERGGDQIEPPGNGPKVEAPRQQTAVLATTNDQPRAETEPTPIPATTASPLTAGEIDDNARRDEYLAYLASYTANDVVRLDVSQRHELVVVDGAERPLLGVELIIQANGQEITRLKTGSNGRSTFYPRPFNTQSPTYTITATAADGSRQTVSVAANEAEWRIALPTASQPAAAQLDILLLIDATSSMADEIDELKSNIRAIASQMPNQPNVQWSLVAYRDRGEPLAEQLFPFSDNLNTFAAALDGVEAEGGGDYAEDVQGALALALEQFVAQNGRQAVKLIFLVADAPPHLDYTDQPSYADLLPQAAALGVKIYPLASSGLDAQGEYIFRQWAQWTNGRFLFLTNNPTNTDSAGNPTISVTSNGTPYTVANLDTLILNLIRQELSYLPQ